MGRCGHVLRAGIELIYTEAQKKAREQMQGAALRFSGHSLTLGAITDGPTMAYATAEHQGLKRKREADDSAVDMPGKRTEAVQRSSAVLMQPCICAASWVAGLQMSRAWSTQQSLRRRSFCSRLVPTRLLSILWHCIS